MISRPRKVGVLGGGQLGRMLIQAAANYPVEMHVLDGDAAGPCSTVTSFFTVGDITDFSTVKKFCSGVDLVTIEIEKVNAAALAEVASSGIPVFPQPEIIAMIQDKTEQKKFFRDKGFPTLPFTVFSSADELTASPPVFPAIQKTATGGYDGRGVKKLNGPPDLSAAFAGKSLVEPFAEIAMEVAVIVARNENGEVADYPAVELVADPRAHILDYLLSPARISPQTGARLREISRALISSLGLVGLLTLEFIIDSAGEIHINEISPRPHNSGHHTIEANFTSQYEQHLRAILNLPLGDTSCIGTSAMLNILGSGDTRGPAVIHDLPRILSLPGVHFHWYGKTESVPGRKMGHVTIRDNDLPALLDKIKFVKGTLRVSA